MKHDFAIPLPDQRADLPWSDESGADAAIVGTGGGLKWVMHQVEQVAPTAATVLLLGETGTGKELVARAIHQPQPAAPPAASSSSTARALPGDLDRERALRPRARGVHRRARVAGGPLRGRQRRHDLPRRDRRAAARAPAEAAARAPGRQSSSGSAARGRSQVDVRIVAATNRDLAEEVRAGPVPPRPRTTGSTCSRSRCRRFASGRDDLPALVRHLVGASGASWDKPSRRIAAGVLQALERHDWPGNVRELENVLQQAIILSRDGVLDLSGFAAESDRRRSTRRGWRSVRFGR